MSLWTRLASLLQIRSDAAPRALIGGAAPFGAAAWPDAVPMGSTRADSVFNPLTGLGGGGDKGAVGRPNPWVIPLTDLELRSLYAFNGLARKIVDLLPSRATRRGWSVPELGTEDRRLQTWDRVGSALTWARLYGGSALLLVTEDDLPPEYRSRPLDWLRQPLDPQRVGRVLALQVLDATEAVPWEWDRDLRSPTYRLPRLWSVTTEGLSAAVHASRIVHFRGARRPPSELSGGTFLRTNSMPDDSALQVIWGEIRRLTETMQGGAVLAQELRESVLKVADLPSRQTGDEATGFAERISLMSQMKSLLGLILIGPNDEYSNRSNPPTGFSDLSDAAKSMLSAVTGIPEIVLFGDSPGGLNTDGSSGHESFRQLVSDYQETQRHALEQLYSVIYAAQDGPTRGRAPDGWALTFAPLDEPTEQARAELRKVVAEMDAIYIQSGVYAPEIVAEQRFGDDGWTLDLTEVPVVDETAALVDQGAQALAAAGATPGTDVQSTAPNGAQIASLVALVEAVATGQVPRDAAVAIAERSFQVTVEEADRMIGSAGRGFVPAAPAGSGPPPTRADAADGTIVLVPAADPGLRDRVERAIGQPLTVDASPHVTVLYVGRGLDDAAVAEVVEAVREEGPEVRPEDLRQGHLRTFPPGPDGVPVVLEFDQAWCLSCLNECLLRRLAHVVTTPQHRRYRAHLTVGYAAQALTPEAATRLAEIDVSEVVVPVAELRVYVADELVATVPVG